MENPDTSETLKPQNPADEIIEDASGFSGLVDLSGGLPVEIPVAVNGGTGSVCSNDFGTENVESRNEAIRNENGIDVVEKEILDVESGAAAEAEENGVNRGGDVKDEENDHLVDAGNEGNTEAGKMEVSGDGISLTVDFSGLQEGHSKSMVAEETSKETGDEKQVVQNGKDYNFSVGDVVWVKTKSQTWWPGKIYHPSDAAKSGDESDQNGSVLVGNFGSGHTAWCSPSQLMPFADNFEEISGKSKSRSFIGAVEKAVEEFGRYLKLEMTCSCFREGNCPLEGDAGSKVVISLPEKQFGSLGKFSIDQYDPGTFLACVKDLAQTVSLYGTLELAILYNQLAAFLRSIGHPHIPLEQLYETCDVEDNAVGKSVKKSKVHVSEENLAGPLEGGSQGSPLKMLSIESEVLHDTVEEKNGDLDKLLDGSVEAGQKNSRRKAIVKAGVKSRSRKRKGSDDIEDLECGKSESPIKEEVISPTTKESKVSGVGNSNIGTKGNYEKSSEMRERKKSKYLSFPYVNWGPKGMPVEKEDTVAPKIAGEGLDANADEGQNETPPLSKCSGKFWRKWYRNITSRNDASGNQKLVISSPAEFLSELHFTAVDCLYPNENADFDSVAQFFSRFRISMFHDESDSAGQNEAMAADLFFLGGKVSETKHPSSAAKSGSKKRKSQASRSITGVEETNSNKISDDWDVIGKSEASLAEDPLCASNIKACSGRLKTKSLSGLSDVNFNISTNNLSKKDPSQIGPLSPKGSSKRKKKKNDAPAPAHPLSNQASDIPDLNGSGSVSGLLLEDQQAGRHVASPKKSSAKRRKKVATDKEHSKVTELSDANDGNKSGSFFIDLQVTAPQSVGLTPGKNEVDFPGADATPNKLVKDQQTVGSSQSKSERKKRKRKEKPPSEGPKVDLSSDIPDLNGMGVESSQRKESNSLSHQIKPKRKRRRKGEVSLDQPSKPSDGRSYIYNKVETDRGGLGSLLVLTFSTGVSLPAKELIVTTFSQYGALKESEIQLKDSTAEIVFVKSADALEAVRSLNKNNVFSPNLIKYQLYHLSAPPRTSESDRICTALAYPASEGLLNSSETAESGPQAGDAPPHLEFIRKNLQLMTSMLEKSGDNLSPDTRAKLESDVERLLKKVSSIAGSSST